MLADMSVQASFLSLLEHFSSPPRRSYYSCLPARHIKMTSHLYIEAALFSTLLGGLPSPVAGHSPEASGAVSSVWSSRDEVINVRIFPDLQPGPATETALQLPDTRGLPETSPSFDGVLICEPDL